MRNIPIAITVLTLCLLIGISTAYKAMQTPLFSQKHIQFAKLSTLRIISPHNRPTFVASSASPSPPTSPSPTPSPSHPSVPAPNRIRKFSEEWAKERGMTPGYGGIWPGDPNAKKYKVTIVSKKTGESHTTMVPSDRYIFFSFEEQDIDLPIINKARMCRQGCCTICTAKVIEGKVKMDAPLGLLKDFRDKGYALTCCTYPKSDVVCELQDEDETYIKQWSEGFEGGGKEWGGFFMDED